MTNSFIDKALLSNRSVLVHCYAGVSRAPAIIMGYLIKNRRLTFDEAMKQMHKEWPKAKPNTNFIRQLQNLSEAVAAESIAVSGWTDGSEQVAGPKAHNQTYFDKIWKKSDSSFFELRNKKTFQAKQTARATSYSQL